MRPVLPSRSVLGRIENTLDRIASGLTLGHRRYDVETSRPLPFVVERPYVIAFDPKEEMIVRILHGARDFRRILGDQGPGIA